MFKIDVIILILVGVIVFLIFMNDTNNKTNVTTRPATKYTTTPATSYTTPATKYTTTPATSYTTPATNYTTPATKYTLTPATKYTTTPVVDNNQMDMSNNNDPNMPDMSKLPNNIQKILFELYEKSQKDKDGNMKPSDQDLMILINAIIQEVGDTKKFINEIQNAPKDKRGNPIISEKKKQLFNLMLGIFMMTDGVSFRNEFAPYTNLNNQNF